MLKMYKETRVRSVLRRVLLCAGTVAAIVGRTFSLPFGAPPRSMVTPIDVVARTWLTDGWHCHTAAARPALGSARVNAATPGC